MSVDSLPEHLPEQAEHLAGRERTRPRQAGLRRAVSTSYYAQFLREDVSAVIDALKASFPTRPAVRINSEGDAFLLSLLLWDKWGKRPEPTPF